MERTKMHSNYISKMQNIHRDDLHYIEKDLLFYEKVAVGFLLYGTDRVHADLILQKLLVLSNNRADVSSILFDYTRVNPDNWKYCLLEALAITKCNRVLKKLGFDIAELRSIFLPYLAETSLFIHPILKALYRICETLTVAEAGKIINDISQMVDQNSNGIRFYDPALMEIYLLHWMTLSLIDVGKWKSDQSPANDFTKINLKILIQYLKLYEKDQLKEVLLNVIKSLINSSNGNTTNQNDEKTTDQNSSRKNQQDNANCLKMNNSCEKMASNLPSNIDDHRYIVRKETAGYILIINQTDFYEETNPELQDLLPKEKLPYRKGSDLDTESLSSVFQQFGYKPHIKRNLTHLEIINFIQQIAIKSIVYDSIIICILSHGIEGLIYGANSIPVKLNDIDQTLANASGLLNKPKMILIQACQGPQMQKPKIVNPLQIDGPNPKNPRSVSGYCDIVKGISTVPGFVSIRHIEEGSWFIQTVCKEVNKLGDRNHILDIMTHVTRNVSNKRGYENECMVPSITQTLTKSFYLPCRSN